MREWFIANALWILIVSTSLPFLILFARRRVQEGIKKATPQKWHDTLDRAMRLIVWVADSIALVFLGLALTAIIVSREGVAAIITPIAIEMWFLEHGITILMIIFFAYLLQRMAKLAIPGIVERSITVRGKGRHAREELTKRAQTLSHILSGATVALIAITALFMVLSEIGLDIGPLLAGAGVVGVAIGFGAQSLIRDLLNGLFILLEDQYNKGDVVRIADISGLVEEVNLRRTVLRDLDGIVHTIPNGEVKTASNYTKEWSRVNINIPVAYTEDLDRVMKVMNRVGKELSEDEIFGPMITGAPRALGVDDFADSGIEIKVLAETKPLMQWDVTREYRKRIKKAFDVEGIEIPWSHIKVYSGGSPREAVLPCPNCSHVNLSSSKFCSNCGASLKPG